MQDHPDSLDLLEQIVVEAYSLKPSASLLQYSQSHPACLYTYMRLCWLWRVMSGEINYVSATLIPVAYIVKNILLLFIEKQPKKFILFSQNYHQQIYRADVG